MRRATTILMLMSAPLMGCATHHDIAIRAIPSNLAVGDRPASDRVAEANAQLALGNVALALEGYRKALREQPDDGQAMVGMAQCYDRMGRFDLSRQHYEAALALDPHSPVLLRALAQSFDVQGRSIEASRVRAEATVRVMLAQAPAAIEPIDPALTRALPDLPHGSSVTIDLPLTTADLAAAETPRPASPSPAIAAAAAPVPAPVRLERMSDHEVVLLTGNARAFAAPAPSVRIAATVVAPPVRRMASLTIDLPRADRLAVLTVARGPVMLLNAGRVQGMAALARSRVAPLAGARIGDAPQALARSMILYGVADRPRALAIARATGMPARRLPWKRTGVTVVLGRDWSGRRARV